jgi:hypothetical protein
VAKAKPLSPPPAGRWVLKLDLQCSESRRGFAEPRSRNDSIHSPQRGDCWTAGFRSGRCRLRVRFARTTTEWRTLENGRNVPTTDIQAGLDCQSTILFLAHWNGGSRYRSGTYPARVRPRSGRRIDG